MNIEAITDDMLEAAVIEAMRPSGAPIKYAEIVSHVAGAFDANPHVLYGVLGPIAQRLKRTGRLEYVKGPGSGWRVPSPSPPGPSSSNAAGR